MEGYLNNPTFVKIIHYAGGWECNSVRRYQG